MTTMPTWNGERIGDMLGARAAETPDHELFCFEDRRVSYSEFNAWVERVAQDLIRHGVRRGDRVMVQLPNCLEALALQMAGLRIGAVDTPVIPIYREHEIRQIVADARRASVAQPRSSTSSWTSSTTGPLSATS